MLTKLSVLLGTILAAAALSACGGDDDEEKKILDTERIERAIEQSILEKRKLRAQVSCPSGTEQKKGATFRCTATYKGGSNPFVVTQDDDKGAVHWEGVDQ
jgi:hypothetical protein